MNLYSFKIFYYEGDVVLPEACGYWKFKVRVGSNTSHRDYSITNIADSSWMYGEVCLNNLDTSYKNNSAICSSDMFQFACHNFPVTFPLQFSDPDQDSLVIQQIPTQTNGWTLNTLPSVDVPYLPPFTLTEPFQTGGTYQFNGSNGGSISFTAPAPQLPILTFKVDEYRNNVWMGSSLRDILFNIVNCNGAVPQMVYDSFNSQGITLSNDTFRVCSGTAFQMVHHYQSSDSNALLQVESNLSTLFSTANWQLSGPGGDSVSSLFSGLPNLSDTGTYSFWIKYTDTSCQAPGVLSPHWKYYTLQVLGSLQSLSNDTLCSGDTLQLQVQGPAPLNWYYSSPGFQCQSLACDTVRIWPSHDAYYIVSSTAASPACVQSDTVQIKVYEDFVVKSTDTSVCSSGSIALQATVQGGSLPLWYNWQPATGVIGSQTQPIVWVDPSLQQQWIVTVSDAQNCFQHSDTSEVLVDTNFHPEVAVGSLPLCIGDSVWMEVLGTNISVLWSPASGLSQMTGTGVYASPMENTLYTVYMVNDLSGCVADTSLWVEVHDIVADAGADRTIHAGETVKLGGLGMHLHGVKNIVWSPPEGLSSPWVLHPLAQPEQTTTYVLQLSDSLQYCTDTDSVTLRIGCGEVFMPNAFHPGSNEGNNGSFGAGAGLASLRYLKVYNRRGNLVFSTTNRNERWDGTYRGQPAATDTYYWVLSGTCEEGEVVFQKGDVLLLR